jgi:tight adherence protein C
MSQETMIIACVFGAVAMVGFFVSTMVVGKKQSTGKLRDRLNERGLEGDEVEAKSGGINMLPVLQKVGQAAAEPFMPKTREKQGAIRNTMGRAGIYSAQGAKVMKGAQVILTGGGLLIGTWLGMTTGYMMLGVALGGLIGYLIPSITLKTMIKSNQEQLNIGLADALDLMVVCVEAGLTVDAAMQRVGNELSIAHPAISREFGIAHMETRVGLARTDALKNMGTRTGNEACQSLASMLIQADRFGTSIAQALRVHADTLRTARQHAAEEMAAKASVKMTFPLVLFIFPATFIVLAGPTVIQLMNSPLF